MVNTRGREAERGGCATEASIWSSQVPDRRLRVWSLFRAQFGEGEEKEEGVYLCHKLMGKKIAKNCPNHPNEIDKSVRQA